MATAMRRGVRQVTTYLAYRWLAGGGQSVGLRLTRVRGGPLASEAVDFDASFRQRLDVLACPRCGTRLWHYRERLRSRHAGRPLS